MPLVRFVIRRLLHASVAIVGVVTVVFLALRVVPGDPADNILGEQASEQDKAEFRRQLCLDRPLHEQYFACLWADILGGTLGESYSFGGRPVAVSSLIAERLPATLELALAGLCVALLIALPLGLLSALRPYSWLDNGAMLFAMVGVAIPGFWLGPLLIHLLCVRLRWLPGPADDLQGLATLVLPAVVLGSALAARLTRMIRASAIEVLRRDYVVAARARGVSERRILTRYVLRNALIPVVTVLGMQLAALLAGTIVTEKVFARPGIGTLLLEAIAKRDYALVQGCVIVVALGYVLVNLAVDILYTAIDPRVRVGAGSRA